MYGIIKENNDGIKYLKFEPEDMSNLKPGRDYRVDVSRLYNVFAELNCYDREIECDAYPTGVRLVISIGNIVMLFIGTILILK